jgi:cytochrome c biogenesis protein CcmG/thiol:disulfide interchange protein DsbE
VNKTVLAVGLAITVPLIAVLAMGFGKDPNRIDSPLVGRDAPPFELKPVGGGDPITLTSMKGKPLVVNFWATWCVPCQVEHGLLQQAAQSMGQHVRFLGVVYDDEDARIQEFLKRHGSGYPALVDKSGKTAIAYGVYGVPETFFIDPRGRIVAKYEGPLGPEALAANVQKLLEAP